MASTTSVVRTRFLGVQDSAASNAPEREHDREQALKHAVPFAQQRGFIGAVERDERQYVW
jgi:hypothetical protein